MCDINKSVAEGIWKMARNWPCNVNRRHQEKDGAFKALPTFQLMFISLTSEPHQHIRCAGQDPGSMGSQDLHGPFHCLSFLQGTCLLLSFVGLGFGVHTYRLFPLPAMTII